MTEADSKSDSLHALALDRRLRGYDAAAQRTMMLRREAVALLALKPGDTVLDVACGTGLMLGALRDAVGPKGRVVGVEASSEMITRARSRVIAADWNNVTLIEAPMEEVAIGELFDAVLFSYTHEVLQSTRALRNLFTLVKPGARIAAVGVKNPPLWLFPLRMVRRFTAGPYANHSSGLDQPWAKLQQFVPDLKVLPVKLGMHYLARGRAPAHVRKFLAGGTISAL
jgi:demethylmenaquinone methyltransferase/2-methoxy-6-polyprenyl-1,4-benzoquinol methylase